jgi:hypothetical protein
MADRNDLGGSFDSHGDFATETGSLTLLLMLGHDNAFQFSTLMKTRLGVFGISLSWSASVFVRGWQVPSVYVPVSTMQELQVQRMGLTSR